MVFYSLRAYPDSPVKGVPAIQTGYGVGTSGKGRQEQEKSLILTSVRHRTSWKIVNLEKAKAILQTSWHVGMESTKMDAFLG